MGQPSPPIRYLAAADVEACLPGVDERLELAARAMLALHRGVAEMPPKIGVHPRPGALMHAMPAWLRDEDLAGVKWVAAYPDNRKAGLPSIHALVVLNDAATGVPTAVMEAAGLTAARTAAVSGLAIRLVAPARVGRVALLGAGVEARSHLPVLGFVRPGLELVIYDRHPERAEELASLAQKVEGIERARPAGSAREAVEGADLVVTVATLTRDQALADDWLEPEAVVVAVDFATYVSSETARRAEAFAVDDRAQFLAYREAGYFDGYPEPTTTLGELLGDEPPGAPSAGGGRSGPVLVTHLGVGLADVLFADAIHRRAETLGAGTLLPR